MSSSAARSERVNSSSGRAARKSRMARARVAARAGRGIRSARTLQKLFRHCKTGGNVKLDLLYEFQPKIKPWSKPHPYGQREAEQRTYDEAIAEIQYADKLGFNT